MRFKLALFILLASSFINIGHGRALAPAPGSNITVKPFLVNLDINPEDSTKQFDLTISNDSKSSQTFHLSTLDFGSLDETGGLTFEGSNSKQITSKYGLTKWLSFSSNDIQLGHAQQKTIKVTIKNDSGLAPGAHYAAVITTASQPGTAAKQLTITPKVSSLVFVTKKGGESYNIHLASISSDKTLWRRPSLVTVRLESTGNTYIIPRGVVGLKQADKTFARGVINDQSSIVLPQTIRSFDVPLTNIAKPKKNILLTRYSVEVDYRYDGVNNFASKSYNYYQLNIPALCVIAVLFIVLLYMARRHVKKRSVKSSTH